MLANSNATLVAFEYEESLPMRNSSGFTLFEALVSMFISSVLMTTAVYNLKEVHNASNTGAQQLASLLKSARAKAMSSTLTYTVFPVSATRVETTFADTCSSEIQTPDTEVVLELEGATMANIEWEVCYTSRGTSNSSADVEVIDGYDSTTVQIVLGGGVRIE